MCLPNKKLHINYRVCLGLIVYKLYNFFTYFLAYLTYTLIFNIHITVN